MIQYTAKFNDGSIFYLFGEDYFNDKRIFYQCHLSKLISFRKEVCKKGFPTSIFDDKTQKNIEFTNKRDFNNWFFVNQSNDIDFGFSQMCGIIEIYFEVQKRIELLINYIEKELFILKNEVFNPWHIDGGYKYIEEQVILGRCSLERIQKENKHLDKYQKIIAILRNYFTIPEETKYLKETIISIKNLKHKELNKDLIIKLFELNLEQFLKTRTEKLLIKTQ